MMITINNLKNFNLAASVTPGQAFRWDPIDGGFIGIVGDRILIVRQEGGSLHVESNREDGLVDFVRDYFDLERDYDEIYRHISTDPPMIQAVEANCGLRLLRQPPWECFASYIMSIHNNIPRIRKMIDAITRRYGQVVSLSGYRAFSFPTPEELAVSCEADLRDLRIGFRSRNLCEAASRVIEEGIRLEDYRKTGYQEVRSFLMSFRGVGEKVADCVALFSLDKFEAFPVDVWIKRTMEKLYFGGKEVPIREIHAFAADRWGARAGYAQTYLFYHARENRLAQKPTGIAPSL